jgi:hypothetical protein
MAFHVDITRKAYRDLSGILRWLLDERAGEQGLSWYAGLVKARHTKRSSKPMPESSGKRNISTRNQAFAVWQQATRVPDSIHDQG